MSVKIIGNAPQGYPLVAASHCGYPGDTCPHDLRPVGVDRRVAAAAYARQRGWPVPEWTKSDGPIPPPAEMVLLVGAPVVGEQAVVVQTEVPAEVAATVELPGARPVGVLATAAAS